MHGTEPATYRKHLHSVYFLEGDLQHMVIRRCVKLHKTHAICSNTHCMGGCMASKRFGIFIWKSPKQVRERFERSDERLYRKVKREERDSTDMTLVLA